MKGLTKEEIEAAAVAPCLVDGWGMWTSWGPEMAVAALRGATFKQCLGGRAGPADDFSRGRLYEAADELAAALGYAGDQTLQRAKRDRPDEVRERLTDLAARKQAFRPKFTKPRLCPECKRPL